MLVEIAKTYDVSGHHIEADGSVTNGSRCSRHNLFGSMLVARIAKAIDSRTKGPLCIERGSRVLACQSFI
jgi:hypothetical protein